MSARFINGCPVSLHRVAFEGYLGLGPGSSEVLVVLFDRAGEPISARDLCKQVSTHRPLNTQALYERIRVLREAMDTEALDSDQGCYFLTEVGMAECHRALAEMAKAMVGERQAITPQPRRPRSPKVSRLQLSFLDALQPEASAA